VDPHGVEMGVIAKDRKNTIKHSLSWRLTLADAGTLAATLLGMVLHTDLQENSKYLWKQNVPINTHPMSVALLQRTGYMYL